MANDNWLDEALEQTGKTPTGGSGFTEGAHTVKIGLAEATTTKTKEVEKADIIKVTVLGDNGEEGEATLWLHSPGGAKMAIIKVLGILVHNQPEDKKAQISEFGKKVFANVKTPAETKEGLLKILNEKLIGKEAFIFAEPQDKYNTTKYVDLWHFDQSNRVPKDAEVDHDNTVDNVDETEEIQATADGLFD
jgi:hypothetical protein